MRLAAVSRTAAANVHHVLGKQAAQRNADAGNRAAVVVNRIQAMVIAAAGGSRTAPGGSELLERPCSMAA